MYKYKIILFINEGYVIIHAIRYLTLFSKTLFLGCWYSIVFNITSIYVYTETTTTDLASYLSYFNHRLYTKMF
jgi:hypothetical protein